MPAKLSTICYIHDSTQRSTKEYSIKEITGISRLSDEDPTKIIYLKIKAFVPLDKEIDTQIEEFENGQMMIFEMNIFFLSEKKTKQQWISNEKVWFIHPSLLIYFCSSAL
ncbi:hypothetical protein RhiirB3_388646 [Rhizophagus irregularis]|nr:hypothetical protein RhiirB3_388646 [Rhizophagus irregularis]